MGLKPSTKNYSNIRFLKKLYRRALQLLILLTVIFLVKTFVYDRSSIKHYVDTQTQEFSQKHGFIIEEIELIASNNYCPIVTKNTFDLYLKQSIFLISLNKVMQHVESFDCVYRSNITRIFPNKLKIEIINKEPIAIWQNKKKFEFITNRNGLMKIRDTKNLDDFIIVTGENANYRIKALLDIIKIEPSIFSTVDSAIRVGDRRWDIKLKSGVEIKLPEKNPEIAWNKYIELTDNPKFQSKHLRIIDLRIPNKIYAR
jgi:cell division protein FtsQ